MFGLDLLGLARYGKVAVDEFPQGFALGAFSGLDGFGDALPFVKQILDSGRCPRVRLHLYWSDLPGHAPERDYLQKIEKEAIRVGKFLSAYAAKYDCQVSAYCELPKGVDGKKCQEVTMKHMPQGVTYVHSYDYGLGGRPLYLPGIINEVHGSTRDVPKGRFNFSYDGEDVFDTEVTAVKNKFVLADTFFVWAKWNNGNISFKPEDKKPRKNRVAWPISRQIDAQILQARDLSGSRMPSDWTCKPVSDQHTAPPKGKDCKPVIITPVKVKPSKLELRAANGQVIDTAPYFDTFNEKLPNGKPGKIIGYRYYFSDWGYLLAEKAKRIQGHYRCEVFADGKRVGTWVPATRAGKKR